MFVIYRMTGICQPRLGDGQRRMRQSILAL